MKNHLLEIPLGQCTLMTCFPSGGWFPSLSEKDEEKEKENGGVEEDIGLSSSPS